MIIKPWYRTLAVGAGLLLSWLILITLEVKAGIREPLKLIYALSILLAFGGFLWAWGSTQWVKGTDGQLSWPRIIALALVSTIVAMMVSLVVGVNYKFAIGGAL